jgi:DnaJ-domain-containing protein 1
LFVDASPHPSYSGNYFKEDEDNNSKASSFSDSGSDEKSDNNGLSSLFDTQRPRDLIGGLRSAISNTLRGTFYGVAAIFSNIPAISSSSLSSSSSSSSSNSSLSPNRGIISGIITNIVTKIVIGIAMPTAGLIVGVYQIARGVLATPSAIIDGFIKCKVFDESERTWINYRLDEDVTDIRLLMEKSKKGGAEDRQRTLEGGRRTQDREATSSSSSSSSSSPPRKKVKSTEYYDRLGIRSDATSSEIRSAYRRRARDVHPDKQPDDPNAMRKFRELSAAYQTLSDPALRKRYDSSGIGVDADGRGGGEASMSPVMLDPLVFFAVLFGSELVEPYIGELGVATTFDTLLKLASSGAQSTSYESWEELKYALGWSETALRRRKRQADIATHLRSRISDYVEGYLAEEAFEESCRTEALGIAGGGSYGATFLLAIGPSVSSFLLTC